MLLATAPAANAAIGDLTASTPATIFTNLALSVAERLGLLVDRETTERDRRRLKTRLSQAKLRQSACIEDINFRAKRGLDKKLVMRLASCNWIDKSQNVLICGPCGVGKSNGKPVAAIESGDSAGGVARIGRMGARELFLRPDDLNRTVRSFPYVVPARSGENVAFVLSSWISDDSDGSRQDILEREIKKTQEHFWDTLPDAKRQKSSKWTLDLITRCAEVAFLRRAKVGVAKLVLDDDRIHAIACSERGSGYQPPALESRADGELARGNLPRGGSYLWSKRSGPA